MRGLAKDPSARWESCAAFVTALRQALAGVAAPAVERTVVMAPFVAATMPFSPLRPPAPVVKPRSRKRRNALIAAAALLVLVVAFLIVAAALAKPTLSLSASTVTAGDPVVVAASRVPANQVGEIELLSAVRTFAFRADANGNVSVSILVPRNIGAGDHTVKICWAAQCRASATLHVIDAMASASPTPATTPSPSPNPTLRPTATPSSQAEISISNYYIKRSTGTETVYGIHFTPGTTVTITFVQGTAMNKQMGTQTASSSGYFSLTFTVPSSATAGPAAIKVCGTSGCLSATVSVTG
jgi:hypothetical protein